jgi:hypothetical protein
MRGCVGVLLLRPGYCVRPHTITGSSALCFMAASKLPYAALRHDDECLVVGPPGQQQPDLTCLSCLVLPAGQPLQVQPSGQSPSGVHEQQV